MQQANADETYFFHNRRDHVEKTFFELYRCFDANGVPLSGPDIENSLFWKIWPAYVKWVCPVLIFGAFVQKLLIE